MAIYWRDVCRASISLRANTEGVRRLAAVRELGSSRQYIYGGKNQISNLTFIYTCAEILLFL